jgi:hypothetical protein
MAFRQPPTTSRRIGFELDAPAGMTVEPTRAGARVRGMTGELEVEIFQAALVIDRDGILEERIQRAVDAAVASDAGAQVLQTVPIELPGASGYRADVELTRPLGAPRPERPYLVIFAVAPHDLGVDGGVLVRVRSATPAWEAVEHVLSSLRILTRRSATANE